MPGSFVETNVLIYLASGDPVKADRAEAIPREGGAISVQVLNELTNVARWKMRMTWPDTHAFLSAVRGLVTVRAMTVETHETKSSLSPYSAQAAHERRPKARARAYPSVSTTVGPGGISVGVLNASFARTRTG